MKKILKYLVANLANFINGLLGYRFPDYFCERDRVYVLLFGIEPDISKLLKRKLKPGMTVLDVGSNVGLITRLCSRIVSATGHVWAFEPDPYTRNFLDHNVSRCNNVTVSPIGLYDKNSSENFYIHPGSGTSNSLLAFEAASHSIVVECMTLDTFLNQHPHISPNCIKIDVEGAEIKVLAGMKNTIERFSSLFLIIEFCPQNLANGGYTTHDFFDILKSLNLNIQYIQTNGETKVISTHQELMNELGSAIYCNLLCHRSEFI